MPSRFEFERAVRASDLPSLSRLLALTIATWANPDTGVIPPRYQPSLSTLASATGMSRASVLTHRAKLNDEKWITFTSPDPVAQRAKKARNAYSLNIPTGSGGDLVGGSAPDLDKPDSRSGADPELGQELTSTRSGADHKSSYGPSRSSKQQGSEPDGPRIAINCQPVVAAMTAAGIHVSWELASAEWVLLEAITKRTAIDVLIDHAIESWHAARTRPRSARYFLAGWKGLPAVPEGTPRKPAQPERHLRAVNDGLSPEERGIF